MYIIGFSNKFFTLWYYERVPVVVNGRTIAYDDKYRYVKNISFDESKARKLYPNANVDLSLRGSESFTSRVVVELPYFLVQYGSLKGHHISELDDRRVLFAIYNSFRLYKTNIRSVVLARRRLIEMGELKRYENLIDVSDKFYQESGNIITYLTKRNYATEFTISKIERDKKYSEVQYLHNDNERLRVTIKRVSSTSYPTMFGECYIERYENEKGDVYIYKGTTPPKTELFVFYDMGVTIKHSEYKGNKQTIIKRPKVYGEVQESIV